MFVRQLGFTHPRDSALVRAFVGPDVEWDLANHLRAAMVDEQRVGNWQRANAGEKRSTPPEPIPRPGIEPKKKSRGTAMPPAELRREIERRRELARKG